MPEKLEQYEPLFLKYRPQTLEDLIGQSSVKDTLRNAINHHKLVHAYLFTGPRGAGKTSSARILAKCLNCETGNGQATTTPCGTCPSCVSISNASGLDVIEIDAASHGNVEDARQLIEKVNLVSVSGNYKVYIIDEVHMLSNAAFNALLKVFEEPPEKVVFILATTEEDKVLPTIKSRCQVFNFKPISVNDCKERMRFIADQEKINIEDEALEVIARKADGAMRDALSLLDQLSVFADENTSIDRAKVLELVGGVAAEDLSDLANALFAKQPNELLAKLDHLFDQGKEALTICREFAEHLLKVLEAFSGELDSELKVSLESYELVQIIDQLSDLEFRLRQSTQSKSLLRAALLKLAYREDILVVKDLLTRVKDLEAKLSGAAPLPAMKLAASAAPAAKPSYAESFENKFQSVKEHKKPQVSAAKQAENAAASSSVASAPSSKATAFEPQAQNAKPSSSFIDYLSPACKGICVSSKAELLKVESAVAILNIPTRFKFLKTKIEAKSDEILSAINKASSEEASSLSVEVVDATSDSSSLPLSPPHLSAEYQKIKPALSDEQGQTSVSKLEEPEEKFHSKSTEEILNETPKSNIDDDAQSFSTGEICCDRNSRMDEIVEMGISTFGGKELIED